MSPSSLILLNYIKDDLRVDWLDSQGHFLEMIKRVQIPSDLSTSLDIDSTGGELFAHLVQSLKNYAAQSAYFALPLELDEKARDEIMQVNVENFGAINFINAVDKHIEETIRKCYIENPEPIINKQEFIMLISTIIAFASFLIVIMDSYIKS